MFKTICICGSMRFFQTMLKEAERLTLEGYIVLMPFALKSDENGDMLDTMHRAKIDMSDEIFVVDNDGRDHHLGESTLSEIRYATAHGKKLSITD